MSSILAAPTTYPQFRDFNTRYSVNGGFGPICGAARSVDSLSVRRSEVASGACLWPFRRIASRHLRKKFSTEQLRYCRSRSDERSENEGGLELSPHPIPSLSPESRLFPNRERGARPNFAVDGAVSLRQFVRVDRVATICSGSTGAGDGIHSTEITLGSESCGAANRTFRVGGLSICLSGPISRPFNRERKSARPTR